MCKVRKIGQWSSQILCSLFTFLPSVCLSFLPSFSFSFLTDFLLFICLFFLCINQIFCQVQRVKFSLTLDQFLHSKKNQQAFLNCGCSFWLSVFWSFSERWFKIEVSVTTNYELLEIKVSLQAQKEKNPK